MTIALALTVAVTNNDSPIWTNDVKTSSTARSADRGRPCPLRSHCRLPADAAHGYAEAPSQAAWIIGELPAITERPAGTAPEAHQACWAV